MTVVVYKWTDASAPQITGQVGSLTTLLDAILVNGYGSKAAAGWTKPYSSTNAAVYLQGGSSFQRYFQVDDNGPGAGLAKEARLYGFETMSAYNTGTGQLTGAPLITGFAPIRKSATADATIRNWVALADNRTIYVFIAAGDTTSSYCPFWFGDFYSFVTADPWKGGISGRTTENAATVNDGFCFFSWNQGVTNVQRIFRNSAGAAGSVACCLAGDSTLNGGNTSGPPVGSLSYPHGPDGGFYLAPSYLVEGVLVVRGRHRGMWQGCHPVTNFTDGNIIPGTGPYAGRTFMIVSPSGSAGNPSPYTGYWVMETTDWPTSA